MLSASKFMFLCTPKSSNYIAQEPIADRKFIFTFFWNVLIAPFKLKSIRFGCKRNNGNSSDHNEALKSRWVEFVSKKSKKKVLSLVLYYLMPLITN